MSHSTSAYRAEVFGELVTATLLYAERITIQFEMEFVYLLRKILPCSAVSLK